MNSAFLLLFVLPWSGNPAPQPIALTAQTAAKSPQTGVITGSVVYRADAKRRWRYSRYYGRIQPVASDDEIALKKTYWEAYQQWPREIEVEA